ncbi:DUF6412 domain-containing protein [Protaetiibacter larvae]|uniref:Uncharacterized protein n=1 Tax=Protaetiibacter larvae TaxID=2592654 RepID=A0A5C1Y6I4_9MICO|nr:DUF6412 domain-containing protein [Protaetiibacter larvae]QEO09653.1 hypothetical protein FLP23_06315 [Protaetiibacter larvae]
MTELSAQLLHGVAVMLGVLGVQGPGVVLATLGAAALVGALAAVLVALVRASAAAAERLIAVGDRDRRHAILLGRLPDASHPDARGHIRSRAPGLAASAA